MAAIQCMSVPAWKDMGEVIVIHGTVYSDVVD